MNKYGYAAVGAIVTWWLMRHQKMAVDVSVNGTRAGTLSANMGSGSGLADTGHTAPSGALAISAGAYPAAVPYGAGGGLSGGAHWGDGYVTPLPVVRSAPSPAPAPMLSLVAPPAPAPAPVYHGIIPVTAYGSMGPTSQTRVPVIPSRIRAV